MEYTAALWSLFLGAVSSIIASAIFLWALSLQKPDIEISDAISKRKELDQIAVYRIKILNKTKRPIINVKVQLHLVTVSVASGRQGGGTIKRLNPVQLKTTEVAEISRFQPKDREADYACTFRIEEDIEELFKKSADRCYLRFTISAVDSFSNFGRVHVARFYPDSIIEGSFEHGNSLHIKPNNRR